MNKLPEELFGEIFRHLDEYSLLNCSMVCKLWKKYAHYTYNYVSVMASLDRKGYRNFTDQLCREDKIITLKLYLRQYKLLVHVTAKLLKETDSYWMQDQRDTVKMAKDTLYSDLNAGLVGASESGRLTTMDMLLCHIVECGVSVDYNCILNGACAAGNLEMVKLSIEFGGSKIQYDWPMKLASAHTHIEIVKEILKSSSKFKNTTLNPCNRDTNIQYICNKGFSPSCLNHEIAILDNDTLKMKKSMEIMRLLYEHGATRCRDCDDRSIAEHI